MPASPVRRCILAAGLVLPLVVAVRPVPAASPAAPPAGFDSPAALNSHLERTWSQKPERAKLLALALQGIRAWPDNAELLCRAGYLESMLGAGDHGADKVYRAWRMDKGHASIQYWAWDVLQDRAHKTKPSTASIPLFLKAIEVKPDYARDGYYYAATHAWQIAPVNLPLATELMQKHIAAGGDNQGSQRELGQLLLEQKKFPEADAAFRASLAHDPKNPWTHFYFARLVWWWKADIVAWAERMEAAVANRNEGFTRQVEAQCRVWLVDEYAGKIGKLGKAREHLQYLVANFPSSKDQATWKERLFWISPRRLTVIFDVVWPTGVKVTEVELQLPVDNGFQKHLAHAFEPKPDAVRVYKRFGNSYAMVTYASPPKRVRSVTTLEVTPRGYAEADFNEVLGDDDVRRYTSRDVDSGVVLDPADPQLARLSASIVGAETDAFAKARLVQSWIESNIKYKVVYPKSIAEYLALGQAECGGHALIFVALCRASGVPARRVFAPLCEVPKDIYLGSHMVSEFWAPGKGWVPVDNSGHVFGRNTSSVFFWRIQRKEDPARMLYPEPVDQKVSYTRWDGKVWTIRRD